MAKQHKRKSGPKTVYARDETETMRLSGLAKRLLRAGAARCDKSVGDFVEHLARTRAVGVRQEEFPADDRSGASA